MKARILAALKWADRYFLPFLGGLSIGYGISARLGGDRGAIGFALAGVWILVVCLQDVRIAELKASRDQWVHTAFRWARHAIGDEGLKRAFAEADEKAKEAQS